MSYVHKPGLRPMEHRTLMQLFDIHANDKPHREAVVLYDLSGRRTCYSFQWMQRHSLFLAASFLKLGWRRGQRVALLIPNRIEFLLNFIALLRIGVNVILLPIGKNVDEVLGLVKLCKSDGIVVYLSPDCSYITELLSSLDEIIPSSKIVLVDVEYEQENSQAKYSYYKSLLKSGAKLDISEVLEEQNQVMMDDPAVVTFTSGSTGESKGAQHAHHFLVNVTITIGDHVGLMELHAECRIFNDRPFYWSGAQYLGIFLVPTIGCTLVSVPPSTSFKDFDKDSIMNTLQNEKCTHFYLTPYTLIDIINQEDVKKYDLSCLKATLTAGQSLHSSNFKKLSLILPKCKFFLFLGLTETGGLASQVFDAQSDQFNSEALDLFPNYEMKIVDKDNKLVPVGDIGEICVRSPIVNSFLGYLENTNATAKVISRTGWVHTNDIGLIDKRGKLTICGRGSQMIKRATVKIFPAEIEKVLVKYRDVKDVLVVGVPDERLYEELCACVIPKEGSILESNADAFEEWMSKQWIPNEQGFSRKPKYVIRMKEFPKTKTGKADRKELRKIAAHKLGL